MKNKSSAAFIVELFLMFLLLLMVIVIITKTFIADRSQSLYARRLTESVILAESTAEVVSAAGNPAEAAAMIAEMDQTVSSSADGDVITAEMDFAGEDGAADRYTVQVRISEEPGAAGVYMDYEVSVYYEDSREALYTLHSGSYVSAGKEGSDAA